MRIYLQHRIDRKEYVDAHRMDKKFVLGEKFFLRVHPQKILICYGKSSKLIYYGKSLKLEPNFVGPFEILERIGLVPYHLALLPNLAHVHDVFHIYVLR